MSRLLHQFYNFFNYLSRSRALTKIYYIQRGLPPQTGGDAWAPIRNRQSFILIATAGAGLSGRPLIL